MENRYIWEFGTNTLNPYIQKYVVIYENKSFYYCKISGSDELTRFRKPDVESKWWIVISSEQEKLDEAKRKYKNLVAASLLNGIDSELNSATKKMETIREDISKMLSEKEEKIRSIRKLLELKD